MLQCGSGRATAPGRALALGSTRQSKAGATASAEEVADEPGEKALEMMRKFSEQYAKRTGTYFCMDKGVTATVIKGLAQHKEELGAPLCPCRHYDDKEAEVKNGFWNCPCIPMRFASPLPLLLLARSI
jgi:ferredoxin-thioredoxin reductase catalytic chain